MTKRVTKLAMATERMEQAHERLMYLATFIRFNPDRLTQGDIFTEVAAVAGYLHPVGDSGFDPTPPWPVPPPPIPNFNRGRNATSQRMAEFLSGGLNSDS